VQIACSESAYTRRKSNGRRGIRTCNFHRARMAAKRRGVRSLSRNDVGFIRTGAPRRKTRNDFAGSDSFRSWAGSAARILRSQDCKLSGKIVIASSYPLDERRARAPDHLLAAPGAHLSDLSARPLGDGCDRFPNERHRPASVAELSPRLLSRSCYPSGVAEVSLSSSQNGMGPTRRKTSHSHYEGSSAARSLA
jgi:hypothetical protein